MATKKKVDIEISAVNNSEVQNLHLKQQNIKQLIYVIRGVQVMLDSDLAMLYGVETKRLNEAVKRNANRFPEDFMFQLTQEEAIGSRSQIATLKTKRGQNIKYLPYAFTRNGIAMLSSVLRSQTAVDVNISIMRAFTVAQQFFAANAQLFQRIEVIEHSQLALATRQEATDKKWSKYSNGWMTKARLLPKASSSTDRFPTPTHSFPTSSARQRRTSSFSTTM